VSLIYELLEDTEITKRMLMCVIGEREFTYLRETILEVDPDAFVVVMSASEVWGRGFTMA